MWNTLHFWECFEPWRKLLRIWYRSLFDGDSHSKWFWSQWTADFSGRQVFHYYLLVLQDSTLNAKVYNHNLWFYSLLSILWHSSCCEATSTWHYQDVNKSLNSPILYFLLIGSLFLPRGIQLVANIFANRTLQIIKKWKSMSSLY